MNDRSYCTEYDLFSDKKQLATLSNIRGLLKGVSIDLRAREDLFARMLRARSSPCAQFVEPCLYNLKNVKNSHGGVLIFVKLQAQLY